VCSEIYRERKYVVGSTHDFGMLQLMIQTCLKRILCFVDRASFYNPLNKANLMHNFS